jgi:hypothetical protein
VVNIITSARRIRAQIPEKGHIMNTNDQGPLIEINQKNEQGKKIDDEEEEKKREKETRRRRIKNKKEKQGSSK